MSPRGQQFCIDFVRRRTFLEVDEVGTGAAAVMAVRIRPTSFNGLVAMREQRPGTVLFVGLVEDRTTNAIDPVPRRSWYG